MNAYSYVRLSSKKQLTGSGTDRQLARPEAICKDKGWTLQKQSFRDMGVSAFSGDNRLKGDLGLFIKLAKEGKLADSPVLILEAFDRFSREDIDESESALIGLLKSGVAIHIAFSNKTFTKDSTTSLADRIEILVALKQAYEYSANLSKRVTDAKQRKITTLLEQGKCGNLDDMSPAYFEWSGTRYEGKFIENEKAEFVKRIFREYLKGETSVAIVRRLNEEKKPAFNGGKWQRASVRHILSSRTVLGEFKGKQIYPQLITPENFEKVQTMLERNKDRKGKPSHLVNLFRGIIFCAECKNPVGMTKNKGRNYAYYRCTNMAEGNCTQKALFRVNFVEEDLFASVLKKDPSIYLSSGNTEAKEKLETLNAKREQLTKKITTLLSLEDDNQGDDVIKAAYAKLKHQKEIVEKEIAGVQLVSNAPKAIADIAALIKGDDDVALKEALENLQKTLADIETRKKLQVLMPNFIERIELDAEKLNFTVKFTSGKSIFHSVPQ